MQHCYWVPKSETMENGTQIKRNPHSCLFPWIFWIVQVMWDQGCYSCILVASILLPLLHSLAISSCSLLLHLLHTFQILLSGKIFTSRHLFAPWICLLCLIEWHKCNVRKHTNTCLGSTNLYKDPNTNCIDSSVVTSLASDHNLN